MQRIREPIRVAVIFGPGRQIRPVWFEWRRRKHEISKITYTWSDKTGDETFLHFAVSNDEALFELIYGTASQNWTLLNLQPE